MTMPPGARATLSMFTQPLRARATVEMTSVRVELILLTSGEH